MALARAGGKNHRIKRIMFDVYELSWSYEVKYGGSRILWHRTMRRDTDKKGAERVRIPEEWDECELGLPGRGFSRDLERRKGNNRGKRVLIHRGFIG